LWAKLLLMLASLVILTILVFAIPKFRENAAVIYVSFLLIPSQIIFTDWLFQALERMKYITILNVLSKLIFTIAVFVFVKEKDDFILQPLLNSVGCFAAGLLSLYFVVVKWKIKIQKPDLSKILSTIKKSSDVFINNLMPNLYNSFSTLLLGFYCGDLANGKLDAGTKFVNISQQFMQVVSRTFFPYLSRKLDKHNTYVKINLALSTVMAILLVVFAPLIIKIFFTEEFYDAIIIMQISSLSIIFLSLSNIYGTNYLIIAGYEKTLRNLTIVISLLGFAISFPLIYFFGAIGAALTITLTRGMLGVGITIKALKIKKQAPRQS
ncbi:MAG: oligosaccharide flippase family protein, partial [Bacteroidales bacterium]|nr:oligosaccharide flippase family protein [Bacteroidales bacterium]